MIEVAISSRRPITIHAGEDFYDPWQGLARVFAVKELCDKTVRIGHGSILGINPYLLKWGQTFICPLWSRMEALDQASRMAEKAGVDSESVGFIKDLLDDLLQVKGSGIETRLNVAVNHDEQERTIFNSVQQWLIAEFNCCKAVIESNPTSNLRVLGLPSYAWVPFWGLVASELQVILGTDNPGALETTIEDEYTRLASAFEERITLEKTFEERITLEKAIVSLRPRILDRYPKLTDAGHKVIMDHWRIIEKLIRKRTYRFAIPT